MNMSDVVVLVASLVAAVAAVAAAVISGSSAQKVARINNAAAYKTARHEEQRTSYSRALTTLRDYLDAVESVVGAAEALAELAAREATGEPLEEEEHWRTDVQGRVDARPDPRSARRALQVTSLESPEAAEIAQSIEEDLGKLEAAFRRAGTVYWQEDEQLGTPAVAEGACRSLIISLDGKFSTLAIAARTHGQQNPVAE
ncbi:hypothetical protein ACWF62_17480 [Rhodococcus sp. NPDC054953]